MNRLQSLNSSYFFIDFLSLICVRRREGRQSLKVRFKITYLWFKYYLSYSPNQEEKAEKLKLKKAIEKGNMEVAKIHAENAIRFHVHIFSLSPFFLVLAYRHRVWAECPFHFSAFLPFSLSMEHWIGSKDPRREHNQVIYAHSLLLSFLLFLFCLLSLSLSLAYTLSLSLSHVLSITSWRKMDVF